MNAAAEPEESLGVYGAGGALDIVALVSKAFLREGHGRISRSASHDTDFAGSLIITEGGNLAFRYSLASKRARLRVGADKDGFAFNVPRPELTLVGNGPGSLNETSLVFEVEGRRFTVIFWGMRDSPRVLKPFMVNRGVRSALAPALAPVVAVTNKRRRWAREDADTWRALLRDSNRPVSERDQFATESRS
jgi:hypothetical protein